MTDTRKRARTEEEHEAIAGIPDEIWTHILSFTSEWLQVPFVCRTFYSIFNELHYEPKRQLTPAARLRAIKHSTDVFFKRIGQFRPIDVALLDWVADNYDASHEAELWFCDALLCSLARHGGTVEEFQELELWPRLKYTHHAVLSAAARKGNSELFRYLYAHPDASDLPDGHLMELAFESGDADFCQEIYDSFLQDKRVVLPGGEDPVALAVARGSVALFRWTNQHGCGYDPEKILETAVTCRRADFLRWFHEQYGQPISREQAMHIFEMALDNGANDDDDISTLSYCLSVWRECRQAGDGAVPASTLEFLAAKRDWQALRWCIEQGATTNFRVLVDAHDTDVDGALSDVLDELGIVYN